MFSQEVSPANPSLSPGEERERTITATSGLRCYERFGRYSPLGSLVRTLLASRRWWSPAKSLRWDVQTIFSRRIAYTERKADSHSTKSAPISKPKDIPSNRLLFQLVPSEHPTEETESGLLPTPNAMDIAHKDMEINERGRRNPKKGKTDHSLGLEDMAMAQLLPTPTALDKGGGRVNKSLSPNAAERPTLALAAKRGLLPTPTATEINHSKRVEELKATGATEFQSRKNGSMRPNGLTDYLNFHGMFPTPSARDWKGCTTPGVKKANGNVYGETLPDAVKRMSTLLVTPMATDGKRSTMTMDALKNHNKEKANLAEQIAHKVGGGTSQLNPLFVEEMMGFPSMWTALPFLSPSGDKNP